MIDYVIAGLVVSPALAASALWGRAQGRRGALPWGLVILLMVIGKVFVHPVTAAVGAAWALGFLWGHRAQSRVARSTSRERKRLRRAISRREMQFHYQPILDQLSYSGPVVVSAESLVRWRQPNGKMVLPGPWLGQVQADPDLSRAFDHSMLEDACTVAGLFPHIRISINTMPERIAQAGWGEAVLGQLRECGGTPHQITVEVVEGSLLRDTDIVRENLCLLHDAGCHIALDDFGSGNANMVTLMAFLDLVDTVKVDQLLIRHEDRRGAEALIRLAKSFGKQVVAEGVETEEQAAWLRTLDVHLVQGWLHSKALPLLEFSAYVMHHGLVEGGTTMTI